MHWDVAGIGNALMDALVVIEDGQVLTELGLQRGTMHPVDHDAWEAAFARVKDLGPEFHSGGSCANTIATAGRLGAQAIYSGTVGDDALGHRYAALMEDACGGHALRFDASHATGKCLALISASDRERTMLTDLGAAVTTSELGAFADELKRTRIAHFEGYTLLGGPTVEVVLEAMRIAKEAGARVSLDAADPFVAHTVTDRFREVLRDHVDIAFLNEEEAQVVSGIADPEAACRDLAERFDVSTVAVKIGSRGSFVQHEGTMARIPVYEVVPKDTTGAGDAYAGGLLFGLVQGWSPDRAGRVASAVAGLTVSQVGAVVEDQAKLASVVASIGA